MKTIQTLLAIAILSASTALISHNASGESAAEREARMAWWKEARFGMFIHWGVYSVLGGTYKGDPVKGIGEWIMQRAQIPVEEYESYATMFNPQFYDAEEWVLLAKEAGMKYIVITSKHHDGFALWDSKVTDWDIMDASPYGRDILAALAAACEKHGIRLCFYHSIMDWHHPFAQSTSYPNYNDREKINPDFPKYIENFMKPQLKELLTNYGDIGVLWFDGEWTSAYTTEMGKDVYNYVRSLKPDIIINNRVDKGRKGMEGLNKEGDFAGDFGTPEQEIPDTGIDGVDWESCMTMNDTWGWKANDPEWKSSEMLIQNLIDIVSKGGNYLLNVGPTHEGVIPNPSVERLKDMGAWLKVNGESIYGAQASPFDKPSWGRFTHNDEAVYAHVMEWPETGYIYVPHLDAHYSMVAWLADGRPLATDVGTEGTIIFLPEEAPDPVATVIKLTLK